MDAAAGVRPGIFSRPAGDWLSLRVGRSALLSALSLAVALHWGVAQAAPPTLAGLGSTWPAAVREAVPPPPTETDTATLLRQAQEDLARAKEDLTQATSADAFRAGAVGETDPGARRALLQVLVAIGERQIDRLNQLQVLQAGCRQLEKELSGWSGFATPPPSPFLKKEELREAAGTVGGDLTRLKSWQAIVEPLKERRANVAEGLAIRLRQLEEKLEMAAGDRSAQIRLRAERDMLKLENRVALERVRGIEIEARTVREEVREKGLRLQLAQRQLQALPASPSFTAADLETLRGKLTGERQRIREEIAQVLAAIQGEEAAGRQSRTAPSDSVSAAPGKDGVAGLVETMQRKRIESLDLKLQTLNWILDFLRLQEDLWERRWASAQAHDREEATDAYERIDKGLVELKTIEQYVEQKRRDTLERLSSQTDDSESATSLEESRSLYLEQVAAFSRLLGTLQFTENLLGRWKEDLDERFRVRSMSDRLAEALQDLQHVAASLWQFELLAVQDTIEVDGQKISGKRSVTVGKVFTALAILIIGYWIAARLAYLAERVAVNRFVMSASHARIARRWLLVLAVMVLAAVSLEMVHIPLTIFAFMGGAVAIGAGFGMQNLFKNLISGLMLLLERPFRPGDLVEVAGIRGRVIDIGMRSSHIRDGNGIETLIPNSTFIEQNVTNWTLSSQSVRIAVKVGVAYGSPSQEVTETLLAVAERHGLVQDKPPPQVLLEDFASDALLFGLYVWIELSPEVDWRVVASDLRFMINKTLSSQGIDIAYPQRDVHLDAEQPLEVRVVGSEAGRGASPVLQTFPGDKKPDGGPK